MNHDKPKKPHEPLVTKTPISSKLEPYMQGVNGGQARRCQAQSKRTGQQCGKPARRGFNVCTLHGAGSRRREKEGTSKPSGRPPVSGMYGNKTYQAILEDLPEASDLEKEQAGLRREATINRMALRNALTLETPIKVIQETIEKVLEGNLDDPYLVAQLASHLRHFKAYNRHIQEMTESVAKIEVAIANIDNKTAQTKMLKEAGVVFGVIKSKVTEYLSADQYEALVLELRQTLAEKGWMIPEDKNDTIRA